MVAQPIPLSAPKKPVEDWREQYAYTLGVQAYIYGFLYVYMSEMRWMQVTQPVNPELIPYCAVNHFWHAHVLGTADSQAGGSPNNDTMYSIAWLDVSEEPLILSVPDVGVKCLLEEKLLTMPWYANPQLLGSPGFLCKSFFLGSRDTRGPR